MIIGSRSIIHPQFPPKKTRVRANINCDIWHIRPHFEHNTRHSKITHYSHMSLGGALPNWVINQVVVDVPSGILKVRDYIKRIYKDIHKKGQLNCPLNLLKIMGIDLGWMDWDPLNKWGLDDESTDNTVNGVLNGHSGKPQDDDVESKEVSISGDHQLVDDSEQKMNGIHGPNGTTGVIPQNGYNHHHPTPSRGSPPKRAQSAYKSPAMSFVSRQNTWSGHGHGNGIGNGQNGTAESGSVGSGSSRHRNRMPNQTLTMQHGVSSQSQSDKSNSSNQKVTPQNGYRPIVVTREQWENGMTLRLSEIKNIGLQRSMSTILSHKKARTRRSSGNDVDLEQSLDINHGHNKVNGMNALNGVGATNMIRTKSENEVVQNGEEDGHKYALSSSLSVRDAASYMTLANCAVSELLQQTDPSSKNYWIPSEAKTPRGIFVYKFIHSRERYYHYMGKAILHHEPKFIFDALTDPSFRFVGALNFCVFLFPSYSLYFPIGF